MTTQEAFKQNKTVADTWANMPALDYTNVLRDQGFERVARFMRKPSGNEDYTNFTNLNIFMRREDEAIVSYDDDVTVCNWKRRVGQPMVKSASVIIRPMLRTNFAKIEMMPEDDHIRFDGQNGLVANLHRVSQGKQPLVLFESADPQDCLLSKRDPEFYEWCSVKAREDLIDKRKTSLPEWAKVTLGITPKIVAADKAPGLKL